MVRVQYVEVLWVVPLPQTSPLTEPDAPEALVNLDPYELRFCSNRRNTLQPKFASFITAREKGKRQVY